MSTPEQTLADTTAEQLMHAGAVAAIVGVMLPNGDFHVTHIHNTSATNTKALDVLAKSAASQAADGWRA